MGHQIIIFIAVHMLFDYCMLLFDYLKPREMMKTTSSPMVLRYYWPFEGGNHWSQVDSPHAGSAMQKVFRCHGIIIEALLREEGHAGTLMDFSACSNDIV